VKLLTNSSGAYLTGDDIADAVLTYGAALANERRVDLVDIPYILTDDHGAVGSVTLTVGWRTEINSIRHDGERAELHDAALLRDLRTRTSALSPNGDTPLNPEDLAYLARSEDYC
jgi:nitrogen fixation protein